MKSVRMLAAGAVVFLFLSALTAPVRACDDRFIERCEAEAEAAFLAETQSASPATQRRRAARPRATAVKPVVSRVRAPHVAEPAHPNEPFRLASDDAQAPAARESPLLRRFRGFIDPQPMTLNSFEALRRPKPDAQHLIPAPAMPQTEEVAVAADDEIVAAEAPSDAVAAVAADPAVAPAPPPAAAPAAPSTAPPAAQQPAPAAVAPLSVVAAPAPDVPGGFPLAKLALTLCAALGVASALRFIVRA